MAGVVAGSRRRRMQRIRSFAISGHTVGQAGVWRDVHAKSVRLRSPSDTDAAEEMYTALGRELDSYLAALPCQVGQCGSIVGVAGEIACLDFIARADVYARVHAKLLQGYALEAIETPTREAPPEEAAERALAELLAAERSLCRAAGAGS
jgi:hypothetical protein